jgi:hypothetical protein
MGVAEQFDPLLGLFCVGCAVGVGAFAVALASCVLRRGNQSLTQVPPMAKCFVSGLLLGLGLFVMLPSALGRLPPDETAAQHVMLIFVASIVAMFLVHHVLMDHQHGGPEHAPQGDIEGCPCASSNMSTPAGRAAGGRSLFGLSTDKPKHCLPIKKALPNMSSPLLAPPVPPPSTVPPPSVVLSGCASAATVLLRALPYTIHAFIDGATLGTSSSALMLVSLALPITLCAVQDVGTIIVNVTATGAGTRVALFTVACFALGFPLGTAATVALFAGADAASAFVPLRACAAGVFIYMAIFEMAPPHSHGRLPSLKYVSAFCAGLLFILASEAAEGWAVGTIVAAGSAHTSMAGSSIAGSSIASSSMAGSSMAGSAHATIAGAHATIADPNWTAFAVDNATTADDASPTAIYATPSDANATATANSTWEDVNANATAWEALLAANESALGAASMAAPAGANSLLPPQLLPESGQGIS